MNVLKIKNHAKIIYLTLAVIVALTAIFLFEQFPSRAFAFGTKIGGKDVGGLSQKEAKSKLEKEINNFYKKEIFFNYTNGKKIVSKSAEMKNLGINFSIEESLKKPFLAGKNEAFFGNLKAKVEILRGDQNFPLSSIISEKKFDEFLTENFGKYEKLPINAEIIFNENNLLFEVQTHQNGSVFNREEIKKTIEENASKLTLETIYLSLKETSPKIKEKEAKIAQKEAQNIIDPGSYTVLADGKNFLIESKTLGSWLSFSPTEEKNCNGDCRTKLEIYLDEELSENYLTNLSLDINTEPKNPTLIFKDGKIKVVAKGEIGKTLNIEKSLKKLQKEILEKKTVISLSLEKKEPSITAEKIKGLKINSLIGDGESNFWGSPSNRIHNINTGVSKFAGVLISPDEEFSFNKTLGEVGAAQGYLPELVIKNNKTIPEYGGGICQVSTTMFRAAINSGMKILERHAHAYPVGYYNPQGFDATIYLPSPDLRFKNNTGGYVLIQSKIEGHTLTFEFYGVDDKRKVVIKGPYQYDFRSNGAMKARLEQELWIKGELIFKDTFLSSYNSPSLYPHPLTEEEKKKKEEEEAKKKAEEEAKKKEAEKNKKEEKKQN